MISIGLDSDDRLNLIEYAFIAVVGT